MIKALWHDKAKATLSLTWLSILI